MRFHEGWARGLVVAFAVAIVAPGAAMLLDLDVDLAASRENRELASPPQWPHDRASLAAVPADASAYLADHFGFRTRLVRWQAALRLWWLSTSPSSDVIRGKDGWLFYAGDGSIEDLTAARPFTVAELEAWRVMIEHNDTWLRGRGIAYVPVIAPDKHAAYPEYLPESIQPVGPTRTDQLLRHLREHSTVRVLDLREPIAAAKRIERVYHVTDTHWNDRGAFAAYTAIMSAVGPERGGPALPRDAFDDGTVTTAGRDLATFVNLSESMPEVDMQLVPRRRRLARFVEPEHPNAYFEDARMVTAHPNALLPRAVVFRDSFGSALIPFLAEHFSRAVFLWQPNMDPAVVVAERPDVVIQEWVGRRLTTVTPFDGVTAFERGGRP